MSEVSSRALERKIRVFPTFRQKSFFHAIQWDHVDIFMRGVFLIFLIGVEYCNHFFW